MTNILSLPEAITYAYDTVKVHIHKNGTGTWHTVKGPMPDDFFARHLKGDERFGVPFLFQDRCRAAMIDIDAHDGASWETVTRAADAILNELSAAGLVGLPFRSGGGHGINIWVIWDNAQLAAGVRAAIRAAIERAGYRVGSGGISKGQVEIFPKQDKAGNGGNCAALPRTALDPLTLDDLPMGQVYWSTSAPVPDVRIVENTTKAPESKLSPQQLDELLSYVPNDDLDYDTWWNTIMAIHDAGGTLEQAEAWSAKSRKHTPGYLPHKWASIKGTAERRVTVQTLKKMAADAGWQGSLVDIDVFPEPCAELNEQGPTYRRVPGKGRYAGYKISNTEQIIACMSDDPEFPWIVSYDEFSQDIIVTERATSRFTRFQDDDLVAMASWFDAHRWEPISTKYLREIVRYVALTRRHNIATQWAERLVWDGRDRYREIIEHMGVEVNNYTLAVVRYWWTAHGSRILVPGYQCDSIIVLVSEHQGIGKSVLIQTLAPNLDNIRTYRDITIDQLLQDDKSARAMKGCLIANLDEMRNFSKRESAEAKAALSRRYESYVPKYVESRQEFGRQCVIYATNNNIEFLDDATGNRRYHVLECQSQIDIPWFEDNREQIWAQGVADFGAHGLAWRQASDLADEYRGRHEIYDEWESLISDYLDTLVTDYVEMSQVLEVACKVSLDKQDRRIQRRAADIMRKLGWEREVKRINTKVKRVWVKTPF